MMKKNKGITLLTLVIVIAVMIILLGIVGRFSIESVQNGYRAREERELANVSEYVSFMKAKLLADEFDVEDKFSGGSYVVTTESLNVIAKALSGAQISKITEVNTSDYLETNHKYLYLTAGKLNSESLATEDIVINDARFDYIVNFFTGTVIALYDEGERIAISGSVKGLTDIMNEL